MCLLSIQICRRLPPHVLASIPDVNAQDDTSQDVFIFLGHFLTFHAAATMPSYKHPPWYRGRALAVSSTRDPVRQMCHARPPRDPPKLVDLILGVAVQDRPSWSLWYWGWQDSNLSRLSVMRSSRPNGPALLHHQSGQTDPRSADLRPDATRCRS